MSGVNHYRRAHLPMVRFYVNSLGGGVKYSVVSFRESVLDCQYISRFVVNSLRRRSCDFGDRSRKPASMEPTGSHLPVSMTYAVL